MLLTITIYVSSVLQDTSRKVEALKDINKLNDVVRAYSFGIEAPASDEDVNELIDRVFMVHQTECQQSEGYDKACVNILRELNMLGTRIANECDLQRDSKPMEYPRLCRMFVRILKAQKSDNGSS